LEETFNDDFVLLEARSADLEERTLSHHNESETAPELVHLVKGTTVDIKGISESKVGTKRLGTCQRRTTEGMRKSLVLRLDGGGHRWGGNIGTLEICRCETSDAVGDTGPEFHDRLLDLSWVVIWNKE